MFITKKELEEIKDKIEENYWKIQASNYMIDEIIKLMDIKFTGSIFPRHGIYPKASKITRCSKCNQAINTLV